MVTRNYNPTRGSSYSGVSLTARKPLHFLLPVCGPTSIPTLGLPARQRIPTASAKGSSQIGKAFQKGHTKRNKTTRTVKGGQRCLDQGHHDYVRPSDSRGVYELSRMVGHWTEDSFCDFELDAKCIPRGLFLIEYDLFFVHIRFFRVADFFIDAEVDDSARGAKFDTPKFPKRRPGSQDSSGLMRQLAPKYIGPHGAVDNSSLLVSPKATLRRYLRRFLVI